MIDYPHIELRGDSPFIIGTQVPVRRIWDWYRRGISAETLIKRYPTLGPAKVLSALAFSFDNKDLVERDMERAERAARMETLPPPPSQIPLR
jgi:uncharacterized protein (DUF433 family)